MGIKWILRTLACIPLLTATSAWSAEVHGRSSTQFQWYNDVFTDKKVAEFGEYLNLSITKIDKAEKFSIQGYGRATQDVRNGQGLNGRLYYLYADYRDLFDKVDIRLGRQFVNYAAGSALIATSRPRTVSVPATTLPRAPRPISAPILYRSSLQGAGGLEMTLVFSSLTEPWQDLSSRMVPCSWHSSGGESVDPAVSNPGGHSANVSRMFIFADIRALTMLSSAARASGFKKPLSARTSKIDLLLDSSQTAPASTIWSRVTKPI